MPLGSVLRQRAGPESSRPLAADVPHALTRPATPASAGHHRSGLRAGRGSGRPWLATKRPGGGWGALWGVPVSRKLCLGILVIAGNSSILAFAADLAEWTVGHSS